VCAVFDSFLTLFVLLVILGVVAWALLGRRSQTTKRRAPTYRRRSPWMRRLPILLIAGALVFLAIAFTQFRFLRSRAATGTVILTMDVSESMGRSDVEPTRLDAAVAAARAFLDGLPPDLRVGLVTFATGADVLVAPAADRSAVEDALSSLPRGEGTVIGDGLAASLDAVEAQWEREGTGPAAVVLLSDGRDTGSVVAPDQAAERAGELEVPVYTVVLGQAAAGAGGANAELLQQIADLSGGVTFTATTAGGLIDIYQGLQTRLSTELAISDSGALFVAIAAIFAIAATISILFSIRAGD
jgi:Ca-activated chloride channel family protein